MESQHSYLFIIDWVMEYVDDKGTINIVNDEGEQYPEKVQVPGRGKTVYVKVYPMKSSVNSEVFLYAKMPYPLL